MTTENEQLLAALADRERRLREHRLTAGQAATLMRAMDAIYAGQTLEASTRGLLRITQEAIGADASLMLRQDDDGVMRAFASPTPAFNLIAWPDAFTIMRQPRRVTDLAETAWAHSLPGQAKAYRSMLSAPVCVQAEGPMALVLLSRRHAAFSSEDHALLRSMCRLLEQSFERARLARRNAMLASLVNSSADASPDLSSPGSATLDASFVALGQAYIRMADWQGQIVSITDDLLSARHQDISAAIDQALARTGSLAGSDRTYVFRLREPGRLDNTHEWVAPGIAPMIDQLQDLPASLLDEWLSDFDEGRAAYIPDVDAMPESSALRGMLQMQAIRSLLAVPMRRDGRITGFVGYDAVRDHRSFLPTEIQLLQSVANAIAVVLDRSAAELAAEKARERLQSERDRLRATLSALPDLVLELDEDGRFIAFNEGARLAPALPPDRFLGRLPEEVLPQSLAASLRHLLDLVDADMGSDGIEYELGTGDDARWFRAMGARKSDNGSPQGHVIVIRDITDWRRQQKQIQRLGKIAELTSNLVIVTDADQCIEWVNPAFERRSGWRLEEVRGKRTDSFLQNSRTDKRTVRDIGQALRRGESVQAELLNQTRYGEEYWVAKDIQPLKDDSGRIEAFVSVQSDITKLKQQHQRALLERARAMDELSEGIAISAGDGRYTYMNRSFRAMYGIDGDEDIKNLTWKDLHPAEMVDKFVMSERPKFEKTGTWRGELIGLRRNGSEFPVEISISLIDGGRVLSITRDISEKVRSNRQLAQLREELQVAQRRETIAQTVAGVAHDLNNLVAVVSGTVEIMQTRSADSREVLQGLKRIGNAMDAARDLVNSIGSLGRPRAPRAMQDLGKLLSDGRELLGSSRITTNRISLVLPEEPQLVWANPTEILQVVVNLALNACESRQDRPAVIEIALLPPDATPPPTKPDIGCLHPGQSYRLFTVRDDGDGIDQTARRRMFENYYTTKPKKGTGLGLPIVAAILRANGGAMWFDSKPGEGTLVTVAWSAQEPADGAESDGETIPAGNVDLKGSNVLVVDDVPEVAEVIAEMLESLGMNAISVSKPRDARDLLIGNSGLWTVLVTDQHMPGAAGIDGAELARLAAGLDPPVPVVMVTALPETVESWRTLFDSVLSKPVNAEDLAAAVRAAVLRQRALRKEA